MTRLAIQGLNLSTDTARPFIGGAWIDQGSSLTPSGGAVTQKTNCFMDRT